MSTGGRRDFLTGRALGNQLAALGSQVADALTGDNLPSGEPFFPGRGPSLVLQTTAMACHFDVILNADGPDSQLVAASDSLDLVHQLEDQLSVYREHSELSQINRQAAAGWVAVEPQLFDLLFRAAEISRMTEGAFDPTSGPLIALWRSARADHRIPTMDELGKVMRLIGMQRVEFDRNRKSLRFTEVGVSLNLGAIGKGFAVDRAAQHLIDCEVPGFLLHGGKSSVIARGTHAQCDGWPIGLRHPLFPEKHLCSVVLKDAAMATSGTAVQWFRHRGKRYGHILDPRTGWPVEGVLSVSVIAPDAALADALATALFVLGPERGAEYCERFTNVGFLMFPPPRHGRQLEPLILGIDPSRIVWGAES